MIFTEPVSDVGEDILVVDDTKANLQLLSGILSDAGYNVRLADDGKLALRSVKAKLPDLIFLDINLPGMDGFEVCRQLKANEKTCSIPVIFISVLIETNSKIKGFQLGAVDFINKPFYPEEVLARIKNHLSIYKLQLNLKSQNAQLLKEITERKQAEKALQESKNFIASVIENIPLMIFLKESTDMRFVLFNRAGEELLGYDRKELLGKNNLDLFPPEQAAHFMAKDLEALDSSTGILDIPEEPINTAKKGKRLLHTRKVCINEGSTKYLLGISEDITERKQVEKALIESEDRLKNVLEGSQLGFWDWNIETGEVIRNAQWAQMLGYTLEEIEFSAKQWSDLQHPDDKAAAWRSIQNHLEGRTPAHKVEYRMRTKGGQYKWILDQAKITSRDPDGKPLRMSGTHTDIDDRLSLQAQLLQSEKMASIGQLAAGVAHEINNPVGYVSSNLKTLTDYQQSIGQILSEYRQFIDTVSGEKGSGPDRAEMDILYARIKEKESELDISYILEDIPGLIRESREGLDRIKKIVLDLKDFSHPGEDVLKLTDINRNLESTLNIVWNELKYKATVTKDYGELPQVNCYPQLLNQVFMNLFVNAAQAIENQGEIHIMTREIDPDVEIIVSDSGKGIAAENLSRIFDPFFTTKEVGKGTGLGLNVSYNIVKKHNGAIDVKSEPGKGATFTIRIPVAGPPILPSKPEKPRNGECRE